ncbi:MAG: aminotransferase class I/II-fold pyridoxal phosphate-dependent enzyme, partial [Clostridia bacterium]|nr:aminotransferase class I/II-fold pyridoxal phosphate-dependent enzyme [Clostridia bacterium]
IDKYGTGVSGSRFLNGTLDMHLELEESLCRFMGYESAMTFSTGFQTNLGIISAIVGRSDYIISDRENHASIVDACKLSYGTTLRYRHNDMEDLETQLKKVPENSGILIVTDGVFSMSGDVANLPKIVELAKKYGARTLVDDAHGFGVLGKGGRGTVDHFGLTGEVDMIMITFSKSLASLGGALISSQKVVDYVKHTSRPFIFSASITPSCCVGAIEALKVLESNPNLPKKLLKLADYLREGLKKRNLNYVDGITPIVPIYTRTTTENTLLLGKMLFEKGVYVNPVMPPATPQDGCLLRLSLMATFNEQLLDEAMDKIKEVFDEFNAKQG